MRFILMVPLTEYGIKGVIYCGEGKVGILPTARGAPFLPMGCYYLEIGSLLSILTYLSITQVCIHNLYLVWLCFKIEYKFCHLHIIVQFKN